MFFKKNEKTDLSLIGDTNPSKEELADLVKLITMKFKPEIKNFNEIKTNFEEKLTNQIYQIANSFVKNADLMENLISGKFDDSIFQSPTLTDELKEIIKERNREFFQRLLAKSSSKNVLDFWFDKGVEIPSDAINIAIAFKSDINIFKFLNEKNDFRSMSDLEKIDILKYANEMLLPSGNKKEKQSFEYLKETLLSDNKLTP